MEKEYNAIKAHKAQEEYCKRAKAPHFAPTQHCFKCRGDIYSEGGYTVEEAGKKLITGCPFCHRSYCD